MRTVAVKSSNDITRLQALVDKKKVVVTEATIRDALPLDDAEGVDCLPNEEIFTELARMGYEKPNTKLTFYKAFFSSQWKFLIHIILQSMSAKRTSWNEFSSAMASAVICLSTDDLSTHSTKYISLALTQKVFANTRRVGNGCSGVKTPLFEGMLVAREPEEQGNEEEQGNADTTAEEPKTVVPKDAANDQPIPSPTPLTPPPQQPQDDKVAQDLEIIKLKTRVKKLEKTNKAKTLKLRRLRKVRTSQRVDTSDDTLMEDVSNQGRVFDRDEDDVKETKEVREYTADTQVEGRQADIYHIDMDHAAKVLSMQEDESEVQEAVEVVTTAKLITEVVAAVSETVSTAAIIRFAVPETISAAAAIPTVTAPPVKVAAPIKEAAIDHVKQKAKEEPSIQRYQVMKKRPQTKAQARRNTMMYLKNTAGFRLDYFKGMTYDDIRPIFVAKFNENREFLLKSKEQIKEEESREIVIINETPAQKAAKRRKLIEEAKEAKSIKQHLQIVPDEDDDVVTEATPLARKVHVVDYQIPHKLKVNQSILLVVLDLNPSQSDASEGFNQIIDFLNGRYIEYVLTVNPTIYVSCIKQFWNTVAIKYSNDVTRLQALVDKKKVVVTEAAIRDALHLDDAEGVDCLPMKRFLLNWLAWGCPEEQSNDDNAAEEPITVVSKHDVDDQSISSHDVSNQGRIIDELDKDEGAELMNEKKKTKE
nr:xylulose kinase-1 [Tanacetum cinerariifolium]